MKAGCSWEPHLSEIKYQGMLQMISKLGNDGAVEL